MNISLSWFSGKLSRLSLLAAEGAFMQAQVPKLRASGCPGTTALLLHAAALKLS